MSAVHTIFTKKQLTKKYLAIIIVFEDDFDDLPLLEFTCSWSTSSKLQQDSSDPASSMRFVSEREKREVHYFEAKKDMTEDYQIGNFFD